MNALLTFKPEQRAEAFRVAEQELGLPAHVLEKDFWVTYLLDALFQQLELPVGMMFKGGTSLSKCYGVIERFSEDIDLALDRDDLGFDGDNAPELQPSSTKVRGKLKALQSAGTQYVADSLYPALHAHLEDELEEEFSIIIDEEAPDNILFFYPRCLDEADYGDSNYVKPVVLIETGTKAAHEPVDEIRITPLIHAGREYYRGDPLDGRRCHYGAYTPDRANLLGESDFPPPAEQPQRTGKSKGSTKQTSLRHRHDCEFRAWQ